MIVIVFFILIVLELLWTGVTLSVTVNNRHSHIIWCKMPQFHHSLDHLWKAVNNTVHCRHPAILATPRVDSYETFESKLCSVLRKNSMPVHVSRHLFSTNKTAHYRPPAWSSYSLLMWSIKFLRPNIWKDEALWLEFGVASGRSVNMTSIGQRYLCEHPIKLRGNTTACDASQLATIVGFDSFKGLPTSWKRMKAGMFSTGGRPPPVEENIQLEVGLFEDTLIPFLKKQVAMEKRAKFQKVVPVGFINIDNDLYSGTRFILHALRNRFVHGSVIHFHELFSNESPPHCAGNDEMRALYEFMKYDEVGYNLQFMPYRVAYQEPAVFKVIKI